MKNFVKYINEISKDPFLGKKGRTTTILMPELDTTEGIYRSLLPSYILNNTPDHRVAIIGMTEKTPVSHNEKNYMITKDLIMQTDHFVFPFVSYPLQPIIDEIRKIKSTTLFSYYIDFNYYTVPESYPHAKEYMVAKMIEGVEMNIKAVDQVIFTNKSLRDYIADKLSEKYKEKFGTNLTWQPLFILPELTKTSYEAKQNPDFVNMLIIGDEYHFSDINWIKGILKDAKVKYKNSLKITILGFNGVRNNKNFLAGLEFDYIPRVPFFKYFEAIKHISPDVLLIPANKTPFNNSSKNYVKYLELAYLNIPVIAPCIKPYGSNDDTKDSLITTNQNGFLCSSREDYFMQIESIFSTREKFDGVKGPAYATAVDYNISLKNNINILKSIYFPENEQK